MKKKWWKSKTIWFNVVTGMGDIAASVLTPEMIGQIQIITTFVISIGNIILRSITKDAVGLTEGD